MSFFFLSFFSPLRTLFYVGYQAMLESGIRIGLFYLNFKHLAKPSGTIRCQHAPFCQTIPTRLAVLLHAVQRREEGNVSFNDALNTFYLRLYGVGHMVKD